MRVFQCDRCKIIVEKHPIVKLTAQKHDLIGFMYPETEFDLCNNCYEKFNKFLNQEEPYDN